MRIRGAGRRRLVVACSLLGPLACAGPTAPRPPARASAEIERPVSIEILSPRPGMRFERPASSVVALRGRAWPLASSGEVRLDVFVLLDVSPGTRRPSGRDVDGDGEVGFDPHQVLPDLGPRDLRCTDPEDSILHAEVAAVRRLLEHLESAEPRLGIGFFSQPGTDSAQPLLPGTPRAELLRTLDDARAREGDAPGLAKALAAARRALRAGPASARRVLLVLHGDARTLPARGGSSARGVERFDFLASPDAERKGAGSRWHALRRPVDLLGWLADPKSDLDLAIRNRSLRADAPDAFLDAYGQLSGRVPVRDGANQIRVSVRRGSHEDGAARLQLDVAPPPAPGAGALWQRLETLRQGNRELLLLLEHPVPPGEAGDLEIGIPAQP